tara:strand:- start:340 stop:525 length:186 start_codon:yes stop_codon:yes gene_type:complete
LGKVRRSPCACISKRFCKSPAKADKTREEKEVNELRDLSWNIAILFGTDLWVVSIKLSTPQ